MKHDAKTDRISVNLDPALWRIKERMVTRQDRPGDVHVLPAFPNERTHLESINCWCVPNRLPDTLAVVVHSRRPEA